MISVRYPRPDEMRDVYAMGFESWSEGQNIHDYINECESSEKYKRGQWHVLTQNNLPISSLITYDLGHNTVGIGSIATSPTERKKGYAEILIQQILNQYNAEKSMHYFLLYTEIGTAYYERFGFKILPEVHQTSKAGTAMLRGDLDSFLTAFKNNVPKYF
jgi:N-acetylglutamate synthase-like GNAT family acetyltransferase